MLLQGVDTAALENGRIQVLTQVRGGFFSTVDDVIRRQSGSGITYVDRRVFYQTVGLSLCM